MCTDVVMPNGEIVALHAGSIKLVFNRQGAIDPYSSPRTQAFIMQCSNCYNLPGYLYPELLSICSNRKEITLVVQVVAFVVHHAFTQLRDQDTPQDICCIAGRESVIALSCHCIFNLGNQQKVLLAEI
jgi:hypothetical protein